MVHESKNMRLIAQDRLLEHGGVGEGMALQKTRDGRRIMWMAHENAPKNYTAVDVTDPRAPKVILQTDLPHNNMRSNSLDVVGDVMAVAYQTRSHGMQPAGIELLDISEPERPRRISFFDRSGQFSRGVHCLWFVDGEYIHCASGAPDFTPTHPLDDQVYMIVDVRDPTRPEEVGRWWLPGTREGDDASPPPRLPKFGPRPGGIRAHNTNVYPERPDRAYVGYFDGGAVILDISDKVRPKPISIWNPAPPFHGLTHTVLPLLSRDLLLITEEAVEDHGADWPKLTWVVDARNERNLVPVSTCPLPPVEEFKIRGGRFGSHNFHENRPGETSFRSDTIVFGSYFNAGVRVFDLSDPLRPEERAFFIPEAPAGSRVNSAQINDVYVDENGLVYAVDRFTGGLYIIEADF
jgi:hypothetical protein